MKIKLRIIGVLTFFLMSCGGDKKNSSNKDTNSKKEVIEVKKETNTVNTSSIDTSKPHLDDKGIGPIKNLELGAIDNKLVEQGKTLFKSKCSACHKISKRFVGPGLKGITQKRSPEWIMNMILNPEEMVVKNALAKKLLEEYSAPMANQSLTETEARAILEYFRTKN
jgi:cytochrome c551/c552